MVSGVERERIRRGLASAADPAAFLAGFQADNGFRAGGATGLTRSALALLDAMNVPRSEVYRKLLGHLKGILMRKLENNPPRESLGELLKDSKRGLTHPHLSDIALKALAAHPDPPKEVMKELTSMDPSVTKGLPQQIRSKMWEENIDAFDAHVDAFIREYVCDAKSAHLSETVGAPAVAGAQLPFPNDRTERNRAGPLLKLRSTVSISPKLLARTMEKLRTLFASTGDVRYCSLRANLIM